MAVPPLFGMMAVPPLFAQPGDSLPSASTRLPIMELFKKVRVRS